LLPFFTLVQFPLISKIHACSPRKGSHDNATHIQWYKVKKSQKMKFLLYEGIHAWTVARDQL